MNTADSRSLVIATVELDSPDRLAECIAPDGSISFWLIRPLCGSGEEEAVHGDAGPGNAPHEQEGMLPMRFSTRLAEIGPRCGRPTISGRQCRARVGRQGATCHLHPTGANSRHLIVP